MCRLVSLQFRINNIMKLWFISKVWLNNNNNKTKWNLKKNNKITKKKGCWVCLKINWIEKFSEPNWIERCFLKPNLLIKKVTVYTSLIC